MAKRYRPVNRDQPFLFPPDMREWLPPDHPVWLVIAVVEGHLDTSAFHAARKTGGAGTAGYDPDMLVTVLVWAYAHQVTSSRRIEQLCGTDVAFKVICAGNTPRHVTISQFRAAFPAAIGEFFAQVLALCAELGMGKLGVVALDGMKISASASKSANRTEGTLRKMAAEAVAAHAAADAAEDDLFGAGAGGDEVPEDAWRPGRRDERIAAALASLEAERAAAEAEREQDKAQCLADAAAGRPRPGRRPAGAGVELAVMKVARLQAAQQAKIDDWQARNAASLAARGRPLRGCPPVPASEYCRVKTARAGLEKAIGRRAAPAAQKQENSSRPGPVRNITDPDARLMPVRGGGFIEGYNTQNVTSEDELIIATTLTQDPADTTWYEPMLRQAENAAAFITARRPPPASPAPGGQPARSDPGPPPGGTDPGGTAAPASLIGLFLADAGYLSEHNLTIDGPDRLIATGKTRDLEKAARDPASPPGMPWTSPHIAAMAARLQTEDGITAYRQRGHIAETPHGHIKHNMRFRQLSMRGKPKAEAEWTFVCAVHNLFKAITTSHLTTAALDRLASQASHQPARPPAPQPA